MRLGVSVFSAGVGRKVRLHPGVESSFYADLPAPGRARGGDVVAFGERKGASEWRVVGSNAGVSPRGLLDTLSVLLLYLESVSEAGRRTPAYFR